MTRLKVRCVDNRPFLVERNGSLCLETVDGEEMISLDVGQIYEALVEDAEYYRVWDNSGEDYLYPKRMFDIVSPDDAVEIYGGLRKNSLGESDAD